MVEVDCEGCGHHYQAEVEGAHRVMCGDARDPRDMEVLVGVEVVHLAFTSPPYAEQRAYDETSGFRPVPPDEYVEWFAPVAEHVAACLALDGSWFVNIKPTVTKDGLGTELYVHDLVAAHARKWGWRWATEFCWERPGMPGHATLRFKNQFEPVYQFTRGRWKMRPWNVSHSSDHAITRLGPGHGGTSPSDPDSNFTTQGEVGGEWFTKRHVTGDALPGNRLPTFAGTHEATGHMAAFPVGLPAFFVKAYTDEGDVVLDPFLGSGSTLIAADMDGRRCLGMELSPAYVDITVARWERFTGRRAVLEPAR